MKFVQKEFSYTYEEKKSKFIAFLVPFESFDIVMNRLKKEHPKARHFVYAYRYLNEFDQIVENSSDDGEPKGTSGKPCLNVLAGNEMINTAVIVVRYFGGVKLGTGGLVRAYGDSVNEVMAISHTLLYEKQQQYQIKLEYSRLSLVEYLLVGCNIKIINKSFQTEVTLFLEGTLEHFEELKDKLPQGIFLENC